MTLRYALRRRTDLSMKRALLTAAVGLLLCAGPAAAGWGAGESFFVAQAQKGRPGPGQGNDRGERPRDIFLGFRRVKPLASPVVENGYIFQIHVATDTTHSAKAVPFCTKWTSTYACGDATAKPVFWRVFADQGTDKDCSPLVMKRQFKQTANPGWVDGNSKRPNSSTSPADSDIVPSFGTAPSAATTIEK